ncbi:MAG: type site-specific deoxyribonuclease, HsdR family, partial [Chloroflexi bacterium]|nr:type site-specific deoxyribonuclease, HsdR family [Chloroflexota bacterium]
DLDGVLQAAAFERVKRLDDAVEAIIVNDDSRRQYLLLAAQVARLFKAILPDPLASSLAPRCALFGVLAAKINALTPEADISEVMGDVEDLLDQSIATQGYVIRGQSAHLGEPIDLGKIDFKALQASFAAAHKRTEAARLRALIGKTLASMVALNRSRLDYLERFQRMIDEYNAGSANVEEFFKQLIDLAKELNEEDRRGIREGLSEEELALFDLLTKPDLHLTKAQEAEVKKVAHELLEALKNGKLVLEWRKKQQARALVHQCIVETLDNKLPTAIYTADLFDQKCELTYQHIFESYYGDGRSIRSIYSSVA